MNTHQSRQGLRSREKNLPILFQAMRLLGPGLQHGRLRAVLLPALTQPDYDHLLWSCELNFVRGEDSFVRAQWAGRPFVWHIYPQSDGVHAGKLEAFADRFLAGAPAATAQAVRTCWRRWNGAGAAMSALPEPAAWRSHCQAWRDGLLAQQDLITRLLGFVAERR